MAKVSRTRGSSSNILDVFIQDSSSTTGAGLGSVTFGSSGLTIKSKRELDNDWTSLTPQDITTIGTFAAPSAASIRFKASGASAPTGSYQLMVLDALLGTGDASRWAQISITGVTNMAPLLLEIDLDPQADVKFWNGTVVSSPATAGIPDVNVKNFNNISAAAVTTIRAFIGSTQDLIFNGNNFLKVSLNDILGTTLTETAGQLAAAFKQFFNIALPTSTMNEITLVDTITTYTGNTKQTGDAFLRLGAPAGASVSADIAAVSALISALNNISAAQVKAQVVAALSTDTYAEPGQGAPSSSIDLATKISWLYKALINQKTQTATLFALYNNAASVVDSKSTVSDDGTTFTQQKLVSGP